MTSNELMELAAQGEGRLKDAGKRLRSLEEGANRLFQTGLAHELEFLRLQVEDGRCELRKVVAALVDNSVNAAEQASVNQVSAALAVAGAMSGRSQ